MTEKQNYKKPFYKKWWVWLIAIVVVIGMIGAVTDDEKEVKSDEVSEDKQTEAQENNDDNEEEKEKDETKEGVATLNDENIKLIESNLEESLLAEQDFGDMFYLEEFDYDTESNKILARIDMQQDPLPDTKEDVADWAETWAWSIAETNADIEEKYHVRVTLVTKFDDDEYALWGHSNYDSDSGEYTFKEEDGMKLYD